MKKAFELSIPSWESDSVASTIEEVITNNAIISTPSVSATTTTAAPEGTADFVELEIDADTPVWELIYQLMQEEDEQESISTETETNNLNEAIDTTNRELLECKLRDLFSANETANDEDEESTSSTTTTGKKRAPLLRTSCTAHTLQLVIKDGLKELPVRRFIS